MLLNRKAIQYGMLLSTPAGAVCLPELPLIDRRDGGNLVVHPPREVWDRSALSRDELLQWSLLVAATADAMLCELPQLEGGCVNYWDAGNWALNDAAPPPGPKEARQYRRLHMHLIGRSRNAADAAWRWGEAPQFPRFAEAATVNARYENLTEEECANVTRRLRASLAEKYALALR